MLKTTIVLVTILQATPHVSVIPVQAVRQAQQAEPTPLAMMESITRMAATFKKTMDETQAALGESLQSQERGTAALNGMLAAAREASDLVSERGEIWRQLDQLLTLWQKHQREMEEKATSDSTYRDQADAWGARIRQANELRNQILRERGRTLATLDGIEADRERILSWYKIGDADRALSGLRKIGSELSEINKQMDVMVATAKRIQQPGAAN